LLDRAYSLKNVDDARALYDEWAETYDEELVDDNGYVAPRIVVDAFAEQFADKDARIIDIGCGTGLAGEVLAGYGFSNVDGLDLSAGMLRVAERRRVYRELVEVDLTGPIDIPADTYDGAVSVGTFTHTHVGPDGIDVLADLVKSGGLICISVNADAYVADGYAEKLGDLEARGRITILGNAERDYIPRTGVRGRVVSFRVTG
jgi:predicted TPR repeat methyltransferase